LSEVADFHARWRLDNDVLSCFNHRRNSLRNLRDMGWNQIWKYSIEDAK
jgi:hypothetical protein